MVLLINKKKARKFGLIIAIGILLIYALSFKIKAFNNIVEPFYQGNLQNSKCVAITCNVDWGEEYLEAMLKTLKEENVKITFLITGRWAKENPDLVRKIQKCGHEIGNHGYMHFDYSNFDYDANFKEIKKAKDEIENITMEKTIFFEPPSGYYNNDTIKAAKALGYIPIKWSVDTIDWKYKDNPKAIMERLRNKELKDGYIILIHPTDATSKSLKDIIALVKEKGYKTSRLKDIFKVE